MNIETEFNTGDIIQYTDQTTGAVIQMKVEKITVIVMSHNRRPSIWYQGGYHYTDKDVYQFEFSPNIHTLTKVEGR